MSAEDLGATPQQLINRAEVILSGVSEWPDEQRARQVEKARAFIELAQAKIALKEYHRAR